MVFILEITNIWQNSADFWFAEFFLEIFKIHRLSWISYGFFGVVNMFHQCLVWSLNFANAVSSKTTYRSILYNRMVGVLCAKEIIRAWPFRFKKSIAEKETHDCDSIAKS
jgi:hypothetical protein